MDVHELRAERQEAVVAGRELVAAGEVGALVVGARQVAGLGPQREAVLLGARHVAAGDDRAEQRGLGAERQRLEAS